MPAAADITREAHFIIIGSQAILSQYPDAPGIPETVSLASRASAVSSRWRWRAASAFDGGRCPIGSRTVDG